MPKNTDKITIEKIAKKLGVATCTVSKALNNATDVSEKTRKKILEYASNVGFTLKKRKSAYRLCVLIVNSDKDNDEYVMLGGFQSEAKKNNTEVVVESYTKNEKFILDSYMSKNKIDGIFIIGNVDDSLAQQVLSTRYPAVVANSGAPVSKLSEVDTDFARAIFDMVHYLHSLGHSKIGFLNDKERGEKFGGYVASMLSHNLNIDLKICTNVKNDEKSGFEAAKIFVDDATAVICASDMLAAGLIRGLNKIGYSVPEDISVTGFGDTNIACYTKPKLTTVKLNHSLIGQTACKILIDNYSESISKRILLNGEIVIRDSAKALKS